MGEIKRILCVDDDQDILDTLNIILASEGYSVQVAISPAAIFQLIQEFDPNLILLDINMPNFNGLEVCKAVKGYLSTENTPIIIISSDERIITAIDDFGANDILMKPFQIDLLLEKIKFYLQ
jgi:DNA-binding response OmpR family regulator